HRRRPERLHSAHSHPGTHGTGPQRPDGQHSGVWGAHSRRQADGRTGLVARYPSGQPIRLSTTVRDVTGALVNAGALTLLVKLAAADGTWTTTGTYASPTNDSTGTYHQDIPVTDLAVNGHYQYTWTATGTGAGVSLGDFDVFDPFETAVLPL